MPKICKVSRNYYKYFVGTQIAAYQTGISLLLMASQRYVTYRWQLQLVLQTQLAFVVLEGTSQIRAEIVQQPFARPIAVDYAGRGVGHQVLHGIFAGRVVILHTNIAYAKQRKSIARQFR